MTVISLSVLHARETASTLVDSGLRLDRLNEYLLGQWARLASRWQGTSKGLVEDEIDIAFRVLLRLMEDTRQLGARLEVIAGRFEDADERVAFEVPALAWSAASLATFAAGFESAVSPELDNLALGGGLSGAFLPISDLAECVRNWLSGRGWTTDADPATTPPTGSFGDLINSPRLPVAEPVKSAFSDLLEPSDRETPEPSVANASVPPQPSVSTIAPESQGRDQWWLDVPVHSQLDLHLPSGAVTAYGCTPTAVSMILDYWHAKDPANRSVSAQDLLTANAAQGVFHNGMSPTQIHDEVLGLGYTVVEDRVNSDFESLKSVVAAGPVMAIVKLGLKSEGENHAVVVTGISPDNELRINDPWDGQSRTYSWETFSKSWGADFGKDAPKNSFVVLRPT